MSPSPSPSPKRSQSCTSTSSSASKVIPGLLHARLTSKSSLAEASVSKPITEPDLFRPLASSAALYASRSQINDSANTNGNATVPSVTIEQSTSNTSTASSGSTLLGLPNDPSSSTTITTTISNILPPVSLPDVKFKDGDVIPMMHAKRTLVLCFDGTGDQFDNDNSNIVQFFSLLKKDDKTQQMVYYQAGIGTYTAPYIATPATNKISKTLDMMVAWNLDNHIMGGYEFLMQNYTYGDKICIFGFSRGAYTARALAGMIHKVGLLPACNHQQVPFAYKMYTRADEIGWRQSTAFKKAFSVDVDIEFIGVWDTVSSVGFIPRTLPFTTSNTAVRYFRHALALDERRVRFNANGWNVPTMKEGTLGTRKNYQKPQERRQEKKLTVHNEDGTIKERILELECADGDWQTDVLEVWFAGTHCDVGGGSVANDARHSLARIPLRWMIRQCFLCNAGIMFYANQLKTIGLDPASLYPVVKPRPPPVTRPPSMGSLLRFMDTVRIHSAMEEWLDAIRERAKARMGRWRVKGRSSMKRPRAIEENIPEEVNEEEEDWYDASCPAYDQLEVAPYWWVLEYLPLKVRYQESDGSWAHYRWMNMGKPRVIRRQHKDGLRLHRSVKLRMEADGVALGGGGKYMPNPRIEVEPIWVD